jgi:hypothetical protein
MAERVVRLKVKKGDVLKKDSQFFSPSGEIWGSTGERIKVKQVRPTEV